MVKKLFPGLLIVFTLALLAALMLLKSSLNSFLSYPLNSERSSKVLSPEAAYVDSAFNYLSNGQPYHLTFLEFGSTSCSECRKMFRVMEMVEEAFPVDVNAVFYNVNLNENRRLTDHFGIRIIPVQVLLDHEGREIFRHVGYISFNDLNREINQVLSRMHNN